MVDFTSEVIASDDYLFSDLIKCCKFFIGEKSLYKENTIIGNELWDLPVIADILVDNEANRNIIKNIFETICIFEKSIPSSGICYIHNLLDSSTIIDKDIRSRSSFIFNQVFKLIRCSESKKILRLIKKHGNPSLSINIDRGPVDKPIIRFNSMPSIKIKIAEGFVPNNNNFKDCYFFMVDGSISTSSELSFLLNKSFENKRKTYFLVCKSFNEEILNTLKQNYYRNTINVIPLQYGFDLESINTLPDLVSITGGLPISPLLGDLISNVGFERMGQCDECKIIGESLTIKPKLNNSLHRKNIAQQIARSSNHEKRELLAKRLAI